MRTRTWCAVAWCVAVVCSASVHAQEGATKVEHVTSVSPLAGPLAVWRAGVKRVETITQPLRAPADDRFGSVGGKPARMAVESSLILTLRGVQPAQGQGIALKKEGKRVCVDLYRGSAIVESTDAELLLQTPEGQIEGKEVCVLVDVIQGKTRVVVVDGTLTFTNDLGSVQVNAGEGSVVAHGKAPAKPQAADAEKETAWSQGCDAPSNMFQDPGFELGERSWKLYTKEDRSAAAELDSTVAHGGRTSARIAYTRYKSSRGEGLVDEATDLVLEPGERYFLRVWFRTEGLTHNGKQAGVEVSVNGARTSGSYATAWYNFEAPPSGSTWRCARFFFVAKGEAAQISFGTDAGAEYEGKLWLDDLYLVKVPHGGGGSSGK